jgi:hypothetical protein
MARPLELTYSWRLPIAVASVGLVAGIAILARGQALGWVTAAVVLMLCYGTVLAVVWVRTQAYLRVDGPVLTVRAFLAYHEIEGSSLVKVAQVLTSRGPSYRLTVRGEDGRLARYAAPTALLRHGHSTLFGWILAEAPQAELDKGSRRTLQILRDRGALPCPDDFETNTEP